MSVKVKKAANHQKMAEAVMKHFFSCQVRQKQKKLTSK